MNTARLLGTVLPALYLTAALALTAYIAVHCLRNHR